jgi:hypothetical protein
MRNLVFTFLLSLCLPLARISAQTDLFCSQINTLRFINNPAELTFNKQNGVYLYQKSQWLNVPIQSQRVSIFCGQFNVTRFLDLGFSISQFNTGQAFKKSSGQAHMAWKGRLGKGENHSSGNEKFLSFGSSLKFIDLTADFSDLTLSDVYDPIFSEGLISQKYWDIAFGAGVKLNWMNFGVSFNSLRSSNADFRRQYVHSPVFIYSLGFNFQDMNDIHPKSNWVRPNILFNLKCVDHFFWQGESLILLKLPLSEYKSIDAFAPTIGFGVRRDLTNNINNTVVIQFNLTLGGKSRGVAGLGCELNTARFGNSTSGNSEFLMGYEGDTKTSRYYTNVKMGDFFFGGKNYIQAEKYYKDAKNYFYRNDYCDWRLKRIEELRKK